MVCAETSGHCCLCDLGTSLFSLSLCFLKQSGGGVLGGEVGRWGGHLLPAVWGGPDEPLHIKHLARVWPWRAPQVTAAVVTVWC